jgi:hypothetical protein
VSATPEDPDAALRAWLRAYAKDHPRRGFRPAYHDARTAFQAGDVTAAAADANQARSVRAEAGGAGRLRVLAGGGAILAADGAVMLVLVGRRRAKRQAARLHGAQPPVAAPESTGQDAVQP